MDILMVGGFVCNQDSTQSTKDSFAKFISALKDAGFEYHGTWEIIGSADTNVEKFPVHKV